MSLNELEQWVSSGWLKRHTPTAEETAELLGVADRDLADCAAAGLSKDWRFGIAYNAALQLAHAVLAAAGYETPKGESHHYRAIQSLAHTIGADAPFLRRFEAFRKKRNAGVYERAGLIAPDEADDMVAMAKGLRGRVEQWLKANHPQLLP